MDGVTVGLVPAMSAVRACGDRRSSAAWSSAERGTTTSSKNGPSWPADLGCGSGRSSNGDGEGPCGCCWTGKEPAAAGSGSASGCTTGSGLGGAQHAGIEGLLPVDCERADSVPSRQRAGDALRRGAPRPLPEWAGDVPRLAPAAVVPKGQRRARWPSCLHVRQREGKRPSALTWSSPRQLKRVRRGPRAPAWAGAGSSAAASDADCGPGGIPRHQARRRDALGGR